MSLQAEAQRVSASATKKMVGMVSEWREASRSPGISPGYPKHTINTLESPSLSGNKAMQVWVSSTSYSSDK